MTRRGTVRFVTRSDRRRRVAALAVFAAGALTACGGDDRPTAAEWAPVWAAEQARIPSAGELLAGGRPLCDDLVAQLRGSDERLQPTPSEALDAAVVDWTDHAEAMVFECPDDPIELDDRYQQLGVFAAEIDAGVDEAAD